MAALHGFTPFSALLGGALLGVASSLLFVVLGRIAGVSGIVGGIPGASTGERAWRVAFLAGLLAGGCAFAALGHGALAFANEQSVGVAIAAGALVGFGTRLGGGCTSGHGLCGMARFSKRSIVATCVFMAAGAAAVFVARHMLHAGGAS